MDKTLLEGGKFIASSIFALLSYIPLTLLFAPLVPGPLPDTLDAGASKAIVYSFFGTIGVHSASSYIIGRHFDQDRLTAAVWAGASAFVYILITSTLVMIFVTNRI